MIIIICRSFVTDYSELNSLNIVYLLQYIQGQVPQRPTHSQYLRCIKRQLNLFFKFFFQLTRLNTTIFYFFNLLTYIFTILNYVEKIFKNKTFHTTFFVKHEHSNFIQFICQKKFDVSNLYSHQLGVFLIRL